MTVLAVGLLGPLAGPYAVIVFAALAGAMWPLSAANTLTKVQGAWLLLRCTLTAVVLTGILSKLLERWLQMPAHEGLAPIAMIIGALGNGWRPVFEAASNALAALAGKGSK